MTVRPARTPARSRHTTQFQGAARSRRSARPKPVALLAVAAIVATSAAACEPENTSAPTPTPAPPLDVQLEAELRAGVPTVDVYPPKATGLVAEYTVTNTSDEAILVVERRPDVSTVDVGFPLPDSEEATWVYADDQGVIHVTKEMFELTHDHPLSEPYTVPAARVQPGESVSASAFALTPLQRIAAVPDEFVVPGPAELPTDATTWVFCVQVTPDINPEREPVVTNYTRDRQLVCSDEAELPPDALG